MGYTRTGEVKAGGSECQDHHWLLRKSEGKETWGRKGVGEKMRGEKKRGKRRERATKLFIKCKATTLSVLFESGNTSGFRENVDHGHTRTVFYWFWIRSSRQWRSAITMNGR